MPSEESSLIDAIGHGGILELSAALTSQLGGITGFASKWRDVYDDPRTPASVKHQMMAFATKVMSQANDIRGKSDYTRMRDKDLEQAGLRLIAKYKGSLPWEAEPDATQEKE